MPPVVPGRAARYSARDLAEDREPGRGADGRDDAPATGDGSAADVAPRPTRLIAGLLIALAVVAGVICVAVDVLA